jgi:hypothetical protein
VPPDDYSPGEKADLSIARSFRPGSKSLPETNSLISLAF